MSNRRWTRRHPLRELAGLLADKDDPSGRWSGFRLILYVFAGAYVATVMRPSMNSAEVALGVAILFGLPVRDLFKKVPASEALGALRAVFDNVMGRAAAAAQAAAGGWTGGWAARSSSFEFAGDGVPAAPGTLTAPDLMPPVARGRPDPEDVP